MQLSSTFCKINSIWVTQPCETPKAVEILQLQRKQSGVGGSRAPSLQSCQTAVTPGRGEGLLPAGIGCNRGVDMCFAIFTGAYKLTPTDRVIFCAALLISQSAGALLPDLFCTTSRGFLLMPSPLI